MNPIFTIFKKEMRDLLRDRRTLMAMIVLPLVLFPIIFTLMTRTMGGDDSEKEFSKIKVAVMTNDNGEELLKRLKRRKDLELFTEISPYEFKNLILEDSIDFGLIINEDFDTQIEKNATGQLELFYAASSSRDSTSYEQIAKTIRAYRQDVISQRLKALGATTAILRPTRTKTTNVKSKKKSITSYAGSVLPLFFVVFCFMGSMYPAIDLFTGEKERGTIETLMVLPVNRFQILIGKLLVIATAGVISGLLNFLGIFLFIKLNADLSIISVIINGKAVFWITLLMIPLATFFAGLLIPISIYAKSFKEAQSLIQPLLIIVIIPVIVAMLPGFDLNLKTAFIPLFNLALASRDIVSGEYNWMLISLVFLSLFIYAGLGILLSRRWFENEQNIFRT